VAILVELHPEPTTIAAVSTPSPNQKPARNFSARLAFRRRIARLVPSMAGTKGIDKTAESGKVMATRSARKPHPYRGAAIDPSKPKIVAC
jgi:hypothetical protein